MRIFVPLCGFLFLAAPAVAAELQIITTGAVQGEERPMAAEFGAANGHEINTVARPMALVRQLVEAGRPADIIIASSVVMESFLASGAVVEGSVVPVGHIGIGVAVREGEILTDIIVLCLQRQLHVGREGHDRVQASHMDVDVTIWHPKTCPCVSRRNFVILIGSEFCLKQCLQAGAVKKAAACDLRRDRKRRTSRRLDARVDIGPVVFADRNDNVTRKGKRLRHRFK